MTVPFFGSCFPVSRKFTVFIHIPGFDNLEDVIGIGIPTRHTFALRSVHPFCQLFEVGDTFDGISRINRVSPAIQHQQVIKLFKQVG